MASKVTNKNATTPNSNSSNINSGRVDDPVPFQPRRSQRISSETATVTAPPTLQDDSVSSSSSNITSNSIAAETAAGANPDRAVNCDELNPLIITNLRPQRENKEKTLSSLRYTMALVNVQDKLDKSYKGYYSPCPSFKRNSKVRDKAYEFLFNLSP